MENMTAYLGTGLLRCQLVFEAYNIKIMSLSLSWTACVGKRFICICFLVSFMKHPNVGIELLGWGS